MIRSVTIPHQTAENEGLVPATFRALGQVVILAGPNGAGKSRYLRAIATTYASAASALQHKDATEREWQEAQRQLDLAREQLRQAEVRQPPGTTPAGLGLFDQVGRARKQVVFAEAPYERAKTALELNRETCSLAELSQR